MKIIFAILLVAATLGCVENGFSSYKADFLIDYPSG